MLQQNSLRAGHDVVDVALEAKISLGLPHEPQFEDVDLQTQRTIVRSVEHYRYF